MLTLPKNYLKHIRRQTNYIGLDLIGFLDLLSLRLSGAYESKTFVSFCTSVKDRFDHLEETFLRNIEDNDTYPNCEFVLLNYNCPDPRTDKWAKIMLKPYIDSGRVNYYYFPKTMYYSQSHSKNLAVRLSKGDVVCNIDADNFTGPSFSSYVSAMLSRGEIFLCGPSDGRGLAGRICLLKKDWLAVGGYDERFIGWGLVGVLKTMI